jgi:hypothetical protein
LKALAQSLENGNARIQQQTLKDNSQAPPGFPDHSAAFLGAAEQQLEALGQLGPRVYLKACTTRRIVDDMAIGDGVLRTNDYLGLGTRRSNASKSPRVHLRVPIHDLKHSLVRFTDYPENFVSIFVTARGLYGVRPVRVARFSVRGCRWSAPTRIAVSNGFSGAKILSKAGPKCAFKTWWRTR